MQVFTELKLGQNSCNNDFSSYGDKLGVLLSYGACDKTERIVQVKMQKLIIISIRLFSVSLSYFSKSKLGIPEDILETKGSLYLFNALKKQVGYHMESFF